MCPTFVYLSKSNVDDIPMLLICTDTHNAAQAHMYAAAQTKLPCPDFAKEAMTFFCTSIIFIDSLA